MPFAPAVVLEVDSEVIGAPPRGSQVTVCVPDETVSLKVAVPVDPEDEVPVMVRVYVPGVVGVPEIKPVLVLNATPAGVEGDHEAE